MYLLELARPEHVERCCAILWDGRAFQREQGFVQWTDGYPGVAAVENDIQTQKGYVLRVDGEIAGYMCVDFAGEPVYDAIEGAWGADTPYATIHRMAIGAAFRGAGLSAAAFGLIEKLCLSKGVKNIRADTHPANLRMRHVLEKNGFSPRGVVYYQDGARLAYDKLL